MARESNAPTPAFRPGQIVRIVAMRGWPEGTPDVRGSTGAVIAIQPRPDGGGWVVSVNIEALEEVWVFDEDEIEGVSSADETELFPLFVRIQTSAEADDDTESLIARWLEAHAGAETVAVLQRTPNVEVGFTTRVDPTDAFERVIAELGVPDSVFDDGWAAEAHWSSGAEIGFDDVALVVALRPWNTTSRRDLSISPPGRPADDATPGPL